jgi:hypothetical protein
MPDSLTQNPRTFCSGLSAELRVTDAAQAGHRVADRLLGRALRRRWRVRTVGADKGYCVREFIAGCRQRQIRPHVTRLQSVFCISLLGSTMPASAWAYPQERKGFHDRCLRQLCGR